MNRHLSRGFTEATALLFLTNRQLETMLMQLNLYSGVRHTDT